MMISEEAKNEARELLDPILSVFAAEDGGIAFAKLRHNFLPEMIDKESSEKVNESVARFMTMVRQFSKLCELMKK
jgi:hypothetical protein